MIWRACERIGIRPPDIVDSWDDNNVIAQAQIIAYSQIRDYEDMEILKAQHGANKH